MTSEPASEIERLLALRAERLRHAPAPEIEQRWLAQFPMAGGSFAVPLDALRGALPLRLVRAVPGCASYIIGLVVFQGELLTALSLASLVGINGWSQDPSTVLVLESRDGALYATDCEVIPRAIAVECEVYERAMSEVEVTGLAEVLLPDGSPTRLIDLSRLVERAKGLDGA